MVQLDGFLDDSAELGEDLHFVRTVASPIQQAWRAASLERSDQLPDTWRHSRSPESFIDRIMACGSAAAPRENGRNHSLAPGR